MKTQKQIDDMREYVKQCLCDCGYPHCGAAVAAKASLDILDWVSDKPSVWDGIEVSLAE